MGMCKEKVSSSEGARKAFPEEVVFELEHEGSRVN